MTAPAGGPSPAPRGADRSVLRFLPAVTLAAVVTVTSTSEWTLARTVLDLPPAVAWAVPVAIDSYVIAALRTRRDVLPAVLVMAGALAAAMGAHLAAAEQPGGELPAQVTAPAAAVILSVLVVVAWRVHVLIDHLSAAASTGTPAPAAAGQPVLRPSVAVVEVQPLREAGTPSVAANGERAASTAPVRGTPAAAPRRPHPQQPSTATVPSDGRSGLTDEQILADLDGRSPGIRALKRTYAIGQSRASRIHQQITDQPPADGTGNTVDDRASNPRNDKDQQQDIRQQTEPTSHSASHEESSEGRTDSTDQTTFRIQSQETHIGITGRVGPSSPTAEIAVDGDGMLSTNGVHRAGEA